MITPKVVIHGLPEIFPDEIVKDLKKAKLKPINVPLSKRLGDEACMYLAFLEKYSITVADLLKIRSLFDIIVE